ncbi:MAG: amidohydrolase [Candidatus Solibacter sp.]|nr:amidohydrolase [Candidatus Solibacter sp.]
MADAHVHFFSHRFYSMLAAQKGDGATAESVCEELGWPVPPEDPAELAAWWVKDLDRHQISRACLLASLPGDEESVIAAVRAYPERFAGYFFLNPLADGAAERAEAGLKAGLKGICLMQAMHGISVADERVRPVLDAAASVPGAVVFVHCGVLSVGVRKRLGLASPFDMRCSDPLNVHSAAMRYPDLRFVIPHFGAGHFREALMAADLCPNVLLDTSSSNSWTKYLSPPPSLEQVFEQALAVAGAGRLLFGTDSSFFPRGWHGAILEQQSAALQAVGTGVGEAEAILGGNLIRLLWQND